MRWISQSSKHISDSFLPPPPPAVGPRRCRLDSIPSSDGTQPVSEEEGLVVFVELPSSEEDTIDVLTQNQEIVYDELHPPSFQATICASIP